MTEGAKAMENLKGITHVVMDKTGTLTEGKLKLTGMKTSNVWKDDVQTLSTLICAAEEHGASAHPVGAAIFRETLQLSEGRWQKYKSTGSLKNLDQIPGQGVTCQVDAGNGKWQSVCVGSLALMKDNEVADVTSLPWEVDNLGTASFVAIDGKLAASILLEASLEISGPRYAGLNWYRIPRGRTRRNQSTH